VALACIEGFVRQKPRSEALADQAREGGAIPTLMLHTSHRTATGIADFHDAPCNATLASGRSSNSGISRRVRSLHILPCERAGLPTLNLVVGSNPCRARGHVPQFAANQYRSQVEICAR
jgi:hypothetical protein